MKKKLLTVFTCTYNRANTIGRTYESLCRQTRKDFKWLVVDDGSTDGTREVVEGWQKKDNGFEIQYVYKENGGLHTGYNRAIELMDTELCVCIDSDDWMPDNAVEIINASWSKYRDLNISGMVGYDVTIQGKRLGDHMEEGKVIHYVQLKENKRYNKDNKIVMRTDLLKLVAPQPSFMGERNFNPIWMIFKIDQMAPMVLLDKTLCIVDYQTDGMAANIVNQFFNSPNSFMELRRLYVNLKYTSMSWKLRHYIHLVANAKMAGKSPFLPDVKTIGVLIAYPFGLLLYYYLKSKHK